MCLGKPVGLLRNMGRDSCPVSVWNHFNIYFVTEVIKLSMTGVTYIWLNSDILTGKGIEKLSNQIGPIIQSCKKQTLRVADSNLVLDFAENLSNFSANLSVFPPTLLALNVQIKKNMEYIM